MPSQQPQSETERPDAAQKIGLWAAISIVVGNMVGTGVYTSLGYQLEHLQSGFHIALLWLAGGVIAILGALCYAELTAALPRSGGEYHFLSEVYHPSVGFVSGWLSLIAAFPGPAAISASFFGSYLVQMAPENWPHPDPRFLAGALIVAMTFMHLLNLKRVSRSHGILTLLKVVLMVVIIVAAFFFSPQAQPVRYAPTSDDWRLIWSNPFFTSIFYVLYAYSGWNAACYVASEVRQPQRLVPLALLIGVGTVALLYLGLNLGFLHAAPMADLQSDPERVALVAAEHIFGSNGFRIVGLIICFGLLSAVSSLIWIGSRVGQRMGQDYRLLGVLGRTTRNGVPANAVLAQGAASLVFLALFPTPGSIMMYVQFLLEVSVLMTVLGVFVLRIRRPELTRPYKVWGYPVTPALMVFWLCCSVTMMLNLKHEESLKGLVTLGAGLIVYLLCEAEERAAARRK